MAKKVIIRKFKYIFEVVRVFSFVGCNGVYKVVFFPPKDWSNETLFDQTRKGI